MPLDPVQAKYGYIVTVARLLATLADLPHFHLPPRLVCCPVWGAGTFSPRSGGRTAAHVHRHTVLQCRSGRVWEFWVTDMERRMPGDRFGTRTTNYDGPSKNGGNSTDAEMRYCSRADALRSCVLMLPLYWLEKIMQSRLRQWQLGDIVAWTVLVHLPSRHNDDPPTAAPLKRILNPGQRLIPALLLLAPLGTGTVHFCIPRVCPVDTQLPIHAL